MNNNHWQDADDFSLRLTDEMVKSNNQELADLPVVLKIVKKIKTNFFVFNKISKSQFSSRLSSEIGKRLEEIIMSGSLEVGLVTIFPKIRSVRDEVALKSIKKIECEEKFLRDSIAQILRGRGATSIPLRGKDTAQEVADIELFKMPLSKNGDPFKFAVVIKGYNSARSKKSLTWKDISHQITRAYQRGKPDNIILVSAIEPADGLITNLHEYSQTVGNPDLIIFANPLELTKILVAYKYLD